MLPFPSRFVRCLLVFVLMTSAVRATADERACDPLSVPEEWKAQIHNLTVTDTWLSARSTEIDDRSPFRLQVGAQLRYFTVECSVQSGLSHRSLILKEHAR